MSRSLLEATFALKPDWHPVDRKVYEAVLRINRVNPESVPDALYEEARLSLVDRFSATEDKRTESQWVSQLAYQVKSRMIKLGRAGQSVRQAVACALAE